MQFKLGKHIDRDFHIHSKEVRWKNFSDSYNCRADNNYIAKFSSSFYKIFLLIAIIALFIAVFPVIEKVLTALPVETPEEDFMPSVTPPSEPVQPPAEIPENPQTTPPDEHREEMPTPEIPEETFMPTAEPPTPSIQGDISSCQNLNSANTVYTLTQNVSSSGTCFNVIMNNVTLDCQGYIISGNGAGYGINSSGYSVITIKSCIVQNFTSGIYFSSSTNNTVYNNTIFNMNGIKGTDSGDSTPGGSGGVGSGIYLSSTNSSNISSNIISSITGGKGGNGGGQFMGYVAGSGGISAGIYLTSSNNNTLSSNNFSSITGGQGGTNAESGGAGGNGAGIYLASSKNNILSLNNASLVNGGVGGIVYYTGTGGKGSGIYITSSINNTINANNISTINGGIGSAGASNRPGGSGGIATGIYLDLTNSSNLNSNQANLIIGGQGGTGGGNAPGPGGGGGISAGIYFDSSNNNTLSSNNFSSITGGQGGTAGGGGEAGSGNTGAGIYLTSSSNNNLSYNNISSVIGGTPGINSYYSAPGGSIGAGIYLASSNSNVLGNNISLITGGLGGSSQHQYGGSGGMGIALYLSSTNSSNISSNIISSITGGKGGNAGGNFMGYVVGSGGISAGIYLTSSNNNTLSSNNFSSITGGQSGTGAESGCNGGNGYGIYFVSSAGNKAEISKISSISGGAAGSCYYAGLVGSSYGSYLGLSLTNSLSNINTNLAGYGIYLSSSNSSNFTNNVVNVDITDFVSTGSANNSFINLTFNSTIWPTKASFTYSGDVKADSANAIADSGGLKNVSKYLNITNQTAANVLLNISYDASPSYENNLRMYKHNGTDWILANTSSDLNGVDTARKTVYANITSFSIFAPLANASKVYSCQDLDQANTVYYLQNDVNNSGTCFNVLANNVTLDCQGYAINYSKISVGYGAYVTNYNFTTVKNCIIQQTTSSVGSAHGIYLKTASNSSIQNNTLTVSGSGAYGVYLETKSSSNTLANNTITSVSYGFVILSLSNSNTLINNNITTSGNTASGIYQTTNFNILTGNSIITTGPNSYGIVIRYSNHSILTNNVVFSSQSWDFYSLDNALNNTVINLSLSSANITFTSLDVAIKSVSSAAQPIGSGNISKYIEISNNAAGSWAFVNFSYDESDMGNANESTLKLYRYSGGAWQFVSGSSVNIDKNYVYGNITSFSIFAPMGDAPLTACRQGGWISNAAYTLAGYVNSSGNCMQIDANNVTLDCQGNTINYSQSATGYAISISGYNFTAIKNCVIKQANPSASGYGIYLKGAANSTISSNTFSITSAMVEGIRLETKSRSNTLANNTFTTVSYGIVMLSGSNSNILTNNNITTSGNTASAIYSSASISNNITDNTITTWGPSSLGSIYFGNTNFSILTNNTIFSNRSWDFYSASNSWNNTVINLSLRSANITFTGLDIALKAQVENKPADSGGLHNISKYLNITNNTAGSWALMNISYSADDIPAGVDENSLNMYKYNGSDWILANTTSSTNGVDNISKVVYANITAFSVFAPLGSSVALDTSPPVVTIISPSNTTYNTTAIDFNVSLDEEGSWCGFSLDGSANTSMTQINTTYFNYTNSSMIQGSHSVTFSCNDTSGNMNTTGARYFSITINTAPNVTSVLIDPSGFASRNYYNITCNATLVDAEQISLTAYWAWYKNGNYTDANLTGSTVVQNGTDTNISTLQDIYVVAGNSWNCTVIPNDGTVNGTVNSDETLPAALTDPAVYLVSPANETSTKETSQTFRCNVTVDSNVYNMSLYIWNDTNDLVYNFTNNSAYPIFGDYYFNYNFGKAGYFKWNCFANDDNDRTNWASSNYTLNISAGDFTTNLMIDFGGISSTSLYRTTIQGAAILGKAASSNYTTSLGFFASKPHASYYCGDNVKNQFSEECDGNDLNGKDCNDIIPGWGGSLACNATCIFDTTGCTPPAPVCGDNVKNQPSEDCDGSDLDGKDCAYVKGLGWTGTLACNLTCGFNTDLCSLASAELKIISVDVNSSINPLEGGARSVPVTFIAYHNYGKDYINAASALVSFTKSVTRSSTVCTPSDIDVYSISLSCPVDMLYYDDSGTWSVSTQIYDNGTTIATNNTQSFEYGSLTAFALSPSVLYWGTLARGSVNQIPAAGNYSVLNNTGNVNINTGSIAIRATNLIGNLNPSYVIYAENFTAHETELDACSEGYQLRRDDNVTIYEASLPKGPVSTQNLYYCLTNVANDLIKQTYSSDGSWYIKIALVLLIRRKKKRLVEQFENEIKSKYGISFEDVVKVVRKETAAEKTFVPASVFNNDIGPAEALVKYMKENLNLKLRDIAKLLKRDERTIWTTYRNSKKKMAEKIIAEDKLFMPIAIFSNRSLSISEAAVIYMRNTGIKNSEIARIFGKDPRNIHTIYNRASRKLRILS